MRDYRIKPSIWDGNPLCRHEFNSEIIKHDNLRFRCGNNTIVGNYKNPKIYSDKNVENIFCSKCGAWKGQLGLEPDFELYIKHLCNIFDEIKRVLKNTGTCWVNLGDTYSGSCQGAGKNLLNRLSSKKIENLGSIQNYVLKYGHTLTKKPPSAKTSIPAKSLCLIPYRFAIEMVDRGWILRNIIVWHKPNCMPQSVKDRFTVDFETVFFFTKCKKYFFEQQFEEYTSPLNRWGGDSLKAKRKSEWDNATNHNLYRDRKMRPNLQGRNKRCVWKIPTKPFKGAHFAVYPEKLVEPMIKAGCPEYVCKNCGKPREKIFKGTSSHAFNIRVRDVKKGRIKYIDRMASRKEIQNYEEGKTHAGEGRKFIGWTDCGCNAGWRPGIVLDPFCGSGTSCVVAKKLGRDFIGIDINPEYIKIAEARLSEY